MKNFAIAAVMALALTACSTGHNAYYYCVDDASGKQVCTKKSDKNCTSCDKGVKKAKKAAAKKSN